MKLKLELKKFSISFLFITFQAFYYNTNQFRHSIIDGLNTTIFGMFENIQTFLLGIAVYLIGYLIFNLVYFIIYSIFKSMKLQKNILLITSLFILIIISINILNDQLIFNDLKEYKIESYFQPVISTSMEIDSTNFKKFEWERKQITTSTPGFVINEKIRFHDDSTFTITGDRIKYGKLYLVRKLFDNSIEYEITRPYEYKNFTTSLSLFDSTTAYPLQIRLNKLFLNSTFY